MLFCITILERSWLCGSIRNDLMYFFFNAAIHFPCVPNMAAVCSTNTQWAELTAWSFTADEGAADEAPHIDTATQQTLHYTLNQQVQFHRIGEDGQVQVVSDRLCHGYIMITGLYRCTSAPNFLSVATHRTTAKNLLSSPLISPPSLRNKNKRL